MKTKLSFLFLLIIIGLTYCKKENPPQEVQVNTQSQPDPIELEEESFEPVEMYVSSTSGLIIRSKPNLESEKIGLIPYGTKVLVSKRDPNAEYVEILNKSGSWRKIQYEGKKGYVFDGFLSVYNEKEIDPLVVSSYSCNDHIASLLGGKQTSYILYLLKDSRVMYNTMDSCDLCDDATVYFKSYTKKTDRIEVLSEEENNDTLFNYSEDVYFNLHDSDNSEEILEQLKKNSLESLKSNEKVFVVCEKISNPK
ncbi:MAG: SH3 domain-containing protein [Leptospiraceae bacterium]|nr:SH3 domain-containing protein [Leptospiraceae bacterium]MCP5512615.1 SH3 domain-containing protein [Leptospiraceae bacterium]